MDLDLTYGISISSEVKKDSATTTQASPSSMSQILAIGLVFNPVSGENAILGFHGRFTSMLSKMTLREGGFSISDPVYIDYTSFIPKVGVGVEPSYYFSKNFSMYFRAGLAISFFPASKYTELKINGDPTKESGYELKNFKDASTSFGTDGIALEFRFLFGE